MAAKQIKQLDADSADLLTENVSEIISLFHSDFSDSQKPRLEPMPPFAFATWEPTNGS